MSFFAFLLIVGLGRITRLRITGVNLQLFLWLLRYMTSEFLVARVYLQVR